MVTLSGDITYLRALEPEDLEIVHYVENREDLWELSNTQTPYSKYLIKEYLEHAHRDIYEVKQLRLVICENASDAVLGFIDLFDFDPKNRRVGLGILIIDSEERNKGIGTESLGLVINYAFKFLNVHQIYCNIAANNSASKSLFEKFNFKPVGLKKDWNYNNGTYQDEILYQLISDVY